MVLKVIYDKMLQQLGPQNWWPADSPEEVIIGAILTQNTSWQNVEKAIENLKRENLLDFSLLTETDNKKLAQLIYSTGYYKQKSKRLKRVAEFFRNITLQDFAEYSPAEGRAKLLQIRGIGKETADSILLYAFQKPVFVIDAYTKRVFSRLGYFSADISYDDAQKFFRKNLPEDVRVYNEFHALIIKFAKLFCRKSPVCDKCFLADQCKNKPIGS